MPADEKKAPATTAAEKTIPVAEAQARVDTWFNFTFPNTRLAQDTESWNWAVRAKEELKKALAE